MHFKTVYQERVHRCSQIEKMCDTNEVKSPVLGTWLLHFTSDRGEERGHCGVQDRFLWTMPGNGTILSSHSALASHLTTPNPREAGKCSLSVCPERRGNGLGNAQQPGPQGLININ